MNAYLKDLLEDTENPFYHGFNKKQCYNEAKCVFCFIQLCVKLTAWKLAWWINKK